MHIRTSTSSIFYDCFSAYIKRNEPAGCSVVPSVSQVQWIDLQHYRHQHEVVHIIDGEYRLIFKNYVLSQCDTLNVSTSTIQLIVACSILTVQSTRYDDEDELSEHLPPVQLVLTAASGPSFAARQRFSSTYDDYSPQFRRSFRPSSGTNSIPQDRTLFGTNWFSNPQTGPPGPPGAVVIL